MVVGCSLFKGEDALQETWRTANMFFYYCRQLLTWAEMTHEHLFPVLQHVRSGLSRLHDVELELAAVRFPLLYYRVPCGSTPCKQSDKLKRGVDDEAEQESHRRDSGRILTKNEVCVSGRSWIGVGRRCPCSDAGRSAAKGQCCGEPIASSFLLRKRQSGRLIAYACSRIHT